MKKLFALISAITAMAIHVPSAQAAGFTWSPYFPFVFSFEDGGWIYYFTAQDPIYAYMLDGPNAGQTTEVAPAPAQSAPASLSGKTITLEFGTTFTFTDATFTETGPDDEGTYTDTGSYKYFKSGTSSGIAILNYDGEVSITTVELNFDNATSGTASYQFVSATVGDHDSGSASFTLQQ